MKRNKKLEQQHLNMVKDIINSDFTLLNSLINATKLLEAIAIIDCTTPKKLLKYELNEKDGVNLLIKIYYDYEQVRTYINKLKLYA